jgi:hypothetical protein
VIYTQRNKSDKPAFARELEKERSKKRLSLVLGGTCDSAVWFRLRGANNKAQGNALGIAPPTTKPCKGEAIITLI